MAVALLTTYIYALLLCALLSLTLQLSTSTTAASDCGTPKTVGNATVNFTTGPSADNWQFIRYKCLDGYKRKAGTSNLAICVFNNTTQTSYWKYGNIRCIHPSIPMTTHRTVTSSTTSGSSSSRDFTSFMKLERSTTTMLTTVTVKNDQTHQTSKTKLNQQTQVPRYVSTTKITTTGFHHTTEGQTTHPAGPPSTTNTVRKGIVTTMTQQPRSSEHASTSRKMTQSFPESTYPSTDETLKLSTISYITTTGHDSNISDQSWWQQERTAGSIGGVLLILTLLVICFIIWIKRRKQHSRVPQEEPIPEQHCADLEEQDEESSNL